MSAQMAPRFGPFKRLEELDELLQQVAKEVGMPMEPSRGLAAGGWVWIWSDLLPPDNPARIAEVQFHARVVPALPTAPIDESGLETSITALAWLTRQRDVAWSRTYLSPYIPPDMSVFDEGLTRAVTSWFSKAWGEAHKAADGLEALAEQRANSRTLLNRPTA